jgi:putative membrane protein
VSFTGMSANAAGETRMRHVVVLIAALLAVPAAGLSQVSPRAPLGQVGDAVTIARDYVAAASASDLFERTASDFVLRGDGTSPGVRRYAQKMITDHHNMTVMLHRVAESVGVRPGVPAMTPLQQSRIELLQATSGAQRERTYLIQQMEAHQEALLLHRGYATAGDVQALRDQARMAAQIVEGHLMELRRLQDEG